MAKFDPKDHLMTVKGGAQYLEVKWRLVWFREEFPNGTMVTEPVEITPQLAIFKATVTAIDNDGKIRGSATGYKTCTPQQFKFGYVEKAETGALGRALACLGFGTQFEPEFDEGDQIVDSPVERPQTARNAPKPSTATPDTNAPANLDRERVLKALHAEGKKQGIDHDDLHKLIVAKGHESMATAPVDALIDLGKAVKADAGKLKAWLEKQTADQAELLPDTDTVPNPDRFTS